MASRATRSAATSGTPEPSSVPSMRQKRTTANIETTPPRPGVLNISHSTARRPASEASARRASQDQDDHARRQNTSA